MTPERRQQVGTVASRLVAGAQRRGASAALSSPQVDRLRQLVRVSASPAQLAQTIARGLQQTIRRSI